MLARLVGGPRVLAQTAATGPWSGALQRAGAMGAPRRWLSALPAGGAGAEPGEPSRPMRPSQEFSQDWKERVRRMNLQAISDKNRVIVPRGGTGREVSVREESLKGSVQKMNHLAKLVRTLRVPTALTELRYCRKRKSEDFMQMINAGVKVAKEKHNLEPEQLQVAVVHLGRGTYLKRVEFKGRGKTGMLTLPYTHVTITLREVIKGQNDEHTLRMRQAGRSRRRRGREAAKHPRPKTKRPGAPIFGRWVVPKEPKTSYGAKTQ